MVRLAVGIELETNEGAFCQTCEGEGYDYQCPVCDGDEWVDCPECDGRGYTVEDVTCEVCGGYGGTDDEPCQECGGDGEWEEEVTCEHCEGRGSVTCPECDGYGRIDDECPDCHGSGIARGLRYEFVPDWIHKIKPEHTGAEWHGLLIEPDQPERVPAWVEGMAYDLAAVADWGRTYGDCGLHIHIGYAGNGYPDGWTADEVSRIVRVWKVLQPIVWEWASPKECRAGWCDPLPADYPEEREWGVPRYVALNAWCAWEAHRTVEFRLWNATDDYEYIETAIWASMAVVKTALAVPENATREQILETFRSLLPESLQERLLRAAA